jgi:excinuclease UvrABC ATPase subunit
MNSASAGTESRDHIIIKNARIHNLRDISLEIPKHQVVVFTGVSGSGKSSLVFDTIYTEAQRQLVETFSTFARARLPKLSRPDVDEIRNISTAIVIDQKRMGRNIRSTVGTATEIYTHLRLLYSRCGTPLIGPSFYFGFNHPEGMCPECKGTGKRIRIDLDMMVDREKTLREGAINHPDYRVGGWNWREILGVELFDNDLPLKDFPAEELNRLFYAEAIPVEKKHGAGTYMKNFEGIVRKLERLHLGRDEGTMSETRKNAYDKYFVYSDCEECGGSRLNRRARGVTINGVSIDRAANMELAALDDFIAGISHEAGGPPVRKIRTLLSHLIDTGVGYLSLNRGVSTLSGGESQRVKMARQLDCDLVDMIYVLDEPSIGLHPRDNTKLIDMLYQLRDRGNSVLVVEHDPDVISAAQWIVDIGPGAGAKGGELVFSGPAGSIPKSEGVTARCLAERMPAKSSRKGWSACYSVENASVHNLKNVSVKIPQGVLTCITGVAGSGKSSLIHDVFCKKYSEAIVVDQSPAGRSTRSNPATYTGIFDHIRREFALETGSDPSLFSFNSKGACPKCSGSGFLSIEMSFLDDVVIACDLCGGKKYRDGILAMKYRGRSIYDVLTMSVEEGLGFFSNKNILKGLGMMSDVGLGYLKIGQPLSTLSGGEAQRIKLASELHKEGALYVMDEPTTGLHMADIKRLISIINTLVSRDNTVIVIEHNIDIIRQADWVIDMGPEGGSDGGYVICEGTPETVAACSASHTGRYI